MKKIFTLFAAVALGFAAYAQEACPSVLSFAPMAEEQDANKVMIELQLVNSSLNLNGFNMEVGRYAVAEDGTLTADETMQWATDEEDDSLAMATLSLQDGKALPTASASNSSLRRPT